MDGQLVLYIGRRTLETAMLVSAPVLGVTLLVGLLTGVVQAVTSIRDMTLGMVVKLAAVGLALLVAGNWMVQVAMEFTTEIFNHMQAVGH
jgi:flagellar biosynthetic protein FliQ